MIVAPESTVTLATFTVSPQRVAGGNPVAGTLTLSAPAPFGGATVTLTPSRRNMVSVPQSVTITEGVSSATFVIGTSPVHGNKDRAVDIEAAYNGVTRTATLTLTPPGAAANLPAPVQCASFSVAPCVTSSAFRIAGATATPRVNRYSFYTPELSLLAESEESTSGDKAIRYAYVRFAGQPLAQIENSTGDIAYYFNDHLGTPVLQTSSTGAVVWRVERDPYGQTFTTRVGADRHQPLAFPGQENDGSKLSYNIYRWYRGGWGRYTQNDPIGLEGGQNLFAYASSNPIAYIDPLGLKVFRCCRDLQVSPFVNAAAKAFGFKHCFIKTNTVEAGLGPANGGPLPAWPVGTPTAITDHSGQSLLPGTTCKEISNVDEQCVNGCRSGNQWASGVVVPTTAIPLRTQF
jgi:RHS repeat-associated protein